MTPWPFLRQLEHAVELFAQITLRNDSRLTRTTPCTTSQSSTAWWRSYRATPEVRPAPSPYAAGPAGSGLTLVSTSLVIGNPAPTAPSAGLLVPFDETAEFWAKGPPLTALYRCGVLM